MVQHPGKRMCAYVLWKLVAEFVCLSSAAIFPLVDLESEVGRCDGPNILKVDLGREVGR